MRLTRWRVLIVGGVVVLLAAGAGVAWWTSRDDVPAPANPAVAKMLDDVESDWADPDKDEARQTVEFLDSDDAAPMHDVVDVAREVPDRLDRALPDKCRKLADELSGRVKGNESIVAAAGIPDGSLERVATDQITALSEAFERCRAGRARKSRDLADLAAGLSEKFDARVKQLKAAQ